MPAQVQSTPIHKADFSPDLYTRARRSSPSLSPYGKRFGGQTTNKLVFSVKKSQQLIEKNEKIRDLETRNCRLEQRLTQYLQQRQALEQTLKERVQMYKRIINQRQQKSQQTLESIQSQFRLEIKQLSQQKQEEERFFQQESQMLNQKIQFLEGENFQLQQKVSKQLSLYSDLTTEIQKLKVQNNALKGQYENMLREKNNQIQKLQLALRKQQKQWKQEKSSLNNELQSLKENKSREISSTREKLQSEIRELQNIRQSQNALKDNEINELKKMLDTERLRFSHTLQAEKVRYDHMLETQFLKNQKGMDEQNRKFMQMLTQKQQTIQLINRDVSDLQSAIAKEELENLNIKVNLKQFQTQNQALKQEIFQCTESFNKQKGQLITIIEELKEQIRLNQMNYVRQKNKNSAINEENFRLQHFSADRDILKAQITELRQLLVQSSKQIEICREKFLSFERENKKLLIELERIGTQNNNLIRIRRELEQEAIKWRQNYLRVR